MNPKVTILLATFNRAHLIVETLVSIQNQTYQNWECLIIDDGGTDNTTEVIAPILAQDNRFQFFNRTETYKKGLPGCRNYGLDIAKGEYVIFFDDDDIVHPDNLKMCIDVIEENDVDFCHYQKLSYVDQKPTIERKPITILQYLTKTDIEKIITQEIGFASCTVMWKKQCFNNCRFNENLLYAEEWECYSRIMTEDFKGVILDNVLYYNRKHSTSNTGEFWNNDPVRRTSKLEACKLVIKHLYDMQLLSYQLGVYFVSLSHFLKEKIVFNYLMRHKKAFTTFEYVKLNLRYYGHTLIKPVYKLKKKWD